MITPDQLREFAYDLERATSESGRDAVIRNLQEALHPPMVIDEKLKAMFLHGRLRLNPTPAPEDMP